MQKHCLLAFETSTSRCTAALLWRDAHGRWQVLEEARDSAADHTQHVLPMADTLLHRAGLGRTALGAVAFGQGPGGFTGLRVGCAAAQGIAYALGLPVVPVTSALALAAASEARAALAGDAAPVRGDELRVVVQDARMQEWYLSAYRVPASLDDAWPTVWAPSLIRQDDLPTALQNASWQAGARSVLVADAAVPDLGDRFPGLAVSESQRPSACVVAWLAWLAWQRGEGQPADRVAPLYVRDKVAFTTAERQAGLGGNPRAAPAWSLVAMDASHLDAVANIEQQVQSFPWSRRSFADGLQAGYKGWVVQEQGAIAGFCMTMFAPDIAHLLVIGVTPTRQGGGMGAALLERVTREAAAGGLPAVLLEVRVSNVRAQAFYQRHGFRCVALRKGYYPAAHGQREDAQVWQRDLGGSAV